MGQGATHMFTRQQQLHSNPTLLKYNFPLETLGAPTDFYPTIGVISKCQVRALISLESIEENKQQML